MIKGKTKTGFKFEIDERLAEDWRLLEAITLADSRNVTERVKGTTTVVDMLLGKNKNQLMEHIMKLHDGYVPTTALTDELASMLSSIKELKNSTSSHT